MEGCEVGRMVGLTTNHMSAFQRMPPNLPPPPLNLCFSLICPFFESTTSTHPDPLLIIQHDISLPQPTTLLPLRPLRQSSLAIPIPGQPSSIRLRLHTTNNLFQSLQLHQRQQHLSYSRSLLYRLPQRKWQHPFPRRNTRLQRRILRRCPQRTRVPE